MQHVCCCIIWLPPPRRRSRCASAWTALEALEPLKRRVHAIEHGQLQLRFDQPVGLRVFPARWKFTRGPNPFEGRRPAAAKVVHPAERPCMSQFIGRQTVIASDLEGLEIIEAN